MIPIEVDHTQCTEDNHVCVHDWRIHWGNLER